MKHSIVAVLLFLTMGPASAGNSYNSNPFIDMMRAMVNMFEAMQAMQNLSVHSGYDRGPVGSYPYSGNRPPGMMNRHPRNSWKNCREPGPAPTACCSSSGRIWPACTGLRTATAISTWRSFPTD